MNKIEERIAGILLTYMSDKTTKTDSDVMIPIKEFYYALIDNNVISLDHLSASDADNQEKTFWNNYKNYESDTSSSMEDKMGTALKDLNDEYKSYLMMAYNMLKDREILNTGNLDDNDETLSEWNAGNISFNDLIEYAITKDIVNISSLNLSSDYLNTEEIYNALLSYVKEELPLYEGFEKKLFTICFRTTISAVQTSACCCIPRMCWRKMMIMKNYCPVICQPTILCTPRSIIWRSHRICWHCRHVPVLMW